MRVVSDKLSWLDDFEETKMQYFVPEEFGDWWPYMSSALLDALDEYRHYLGFPIRISPAVGAIGRRAGQHVWSQHNMDVWGEVRAIDVMPLNGDLVFAAKRARDVQRFSGIGVYPHWKPLPGLHLDVRTSRTPQDPATWGGIKVDGKQEYVSAQEAIQRYKEDRLEESHDERSDPR